MIIEIEKKYWEKLEKTTLLSFDQTWNSTTEYLRKNVKLSKYLVKMQDVKYDFKKVITTLWLAHTHLNHWWKFLWVVDLCDCVKPESLCKVDSKVFSNWLNQPGSQLIFDKHYLQQKCLWKRKKKSDAF